MISFVILYGELFFMGQKRELSQKHFLVTRKSTCFWKPNLIIGFGDKNLEVLAFRVYESCIGSFVLNVDQEINQNQL